MAVGPWGEVGDVAMALLPILLVIVLTLKKSPPPPTVSLPVAAGVAWLLRLGYFRSDPNIVNAQMIAEALGATSVISIIYGAVALFQAMEMTGCLEWISCVMKEKAGGHPVAEALIIGWGFVNIVEGSSGFGTPVALGSPILIELGHDPLHAISATLAMDALCTNFGAVGTPVWFGFGQVLDDFSPGRAHRVGFVCAVLQAGAAALVVPIAASFLSSLGAVRASLPFVLLATASVSVPSVLLALWDYEFSTLGGGLVGFPVILLLVHYRVGLAHYTPEELERKEKSQGSVPRTGTNRSTEGAINVIVAAVASGATPPPPPPPPPPTTTTISRYRVEDSQDLLSDPLIDRTTECRHDGDGDDEVLANGHYDDDVERRLNARESALERSRGRKGRGGGGGGADLRSAWRYTFPITASVLILVLTRVQSLGLKRLLTSTSPRGAVGLGSLGELRISASLVITLKRILGESDATFAFQTLYQPFILPFVVVAFLTLLLHREELKRRHGGGKSLAVLCRQPFVTAAERCRGPAVALLGAMALVGLLTASTVNEDDSGGDDDGSDHSDAPADIIGRNLSRWFGDWFVVLIAPIGAMGSFFSGSATVSNLTFGAIQEKVAEDMGCSIAAVLGLQNAAGASGNMICLGNIIAAKSVCGCAIPEGTFIRKTAPICALHCLVITLIAFAFLYE